MNDILSLEKVICRALLILISRYTSLDNVELDATFFAMHRINGKRSVLKYSDESSRKFDNHDTVYLGCCSIPTKTTGLLIGLTGQQMIPNCDYRDS